MLSVSMEHKNRMLEKAAEENKCAADDILNCLRIIGESGEKRINLFVKETRGNGPDNPSRV